MKVDSTIRRILETIQVEVKEKFNKDISLEHLHKVVMAQIEATKMGIDKKVSVHWLGFCKFVFTDKKGNKDKVIAYKDKLAQDTGISLSSKIKKMKDFIITTAEKKRTLVSEQKNGTAITVEELSPDMKRDTKTSDGLLIFTRIK